MMFERRFWFIVLESPGNHFSFSYASNALQDTQTFPDDFFYLGALKSYSLY